MHTHAAVEEFTSTQIAVTILGRLVAIGEAAEADARPTCCVYAAQRWYQQIVLHCHEVSICMALRAMKSVPRPGRS